ncbi:hypothetical protein BKA67DRAFT_555568 [Truncatella angustata]|uniref:Uncharacterized protein n=1 Tax=Truncatella angustata TaxID=152316 RepID=A0A9P8ZZR5_9PEZI|nr:uncharacterized protein BKA67DRAFT_555568 [Truncatella angustata]KAH6657542.1 hypothetical protein BKA67DRAFT_555568 [Truncatella angustata]
MSYICYIYYCGPVPSVHLLSPVLIGLKKLDVSLLHLQMCQYQADDHHGCDQLDSPECRYIITALAFAEKFNMFRRKRINITFVFSLGLFVVIASCICLEFIVIMAR